MSEQRIVRAKRFLARYEQGLPPVCLECLRESVQDATECSDCGRPLTDGAFALVTLLEAVDPVLVQDARRRAAGWSDPGGEPADGRSCPRCGCATDASSGACEQCLLELVRESEQLEGEVEPDPEERARVSELQTFLATEQDETVLHCPSCLGELVPGARGCEACGKPALAWLELEAHLRREITDTIADWFVPVLDNQDARLFEEILGLIDDSPQPIEARVCSRPMAFSAIFGMYSSYGSLLFVRRKHVPALLDLLSTSTATDVTNLRSRLTEVAKAEYDDVWCAEA